MIKKALTALALRMSERQTLKDIGHLAKHVLSQRRRMPQFLNGVSDLAGYHAQETSTWIRADAIASGSAGRFDACDLSAYLTIATLAGVRAIPAKVILTLSEEEAAIACGSIRMDGPRSQRIAAKLSRSLLPYLENEPTPDEQSLPTEEDKISEMLHAALDGLPENVMVRHARCGSEHLKTMAGCGLAGGKIEEIAFGPNLAFGPGWIRRGNRRIIDAQNHRIVEAIARGPVGPTQFVARPWVRAARWRVGEDPHRADSPFQGKGAWPCEWRAFVEHNEVVGVSNYYGWLGEANPLEARKALEVRALAQKMLDVMTTQRLQPVLMDVLMLKNSPHFQEALAPWIKEDDISCTLDFIETAEGMTLLEGGPAHTPIGGGHCCAFAGTRGAPVHGNPMDVHGVAFRLLDGVILTDMASWKNGLTADRAGRILSWTDVETLSELA